MPSVPKTCKEEEGPTRYSGRREGGGVQRNGRLYRDISINYQRIYQIGLNCKSSLTVAAIYNNQSQGVGGGNSLSEAAVDATEDLFPEVPWLTGVLSAVRGNMVVILLMPVRSGEVEYSSIGGGIDGVEKVS